jgi:hypothetical protein
MLSLIAVCISGESLLSSRVLPPAATPIFANRVTDSFSDGCVEQNCRRKLRNAEKLRR